MYKIKPTPHKGLGLFATIPIQRGTRILSEQPLLSLSHTQDSSHIYDASLLIPASARSALLSLSSHTTLESRIIRNLRAFLACTTSSISTFLASKGRIKNESVKNEDGNGNIKPNHKISRLSWWSSIQQHALITSIFRSNAFNIGIGSTSGAPYHQAVFRTISRINHSCIPNSQANFHPSLQKFNVHATRDIEAGEEVTISYLGESGAGRETRGEQLMRDYGFECDCGACNRSRDGERGEERRREMRESMREFAGGFVEGKVDLEGELRTIVAYVEMLAGEGLAGREVSTLYMEAARLSSLVGRTEEALDYAEKGLKLDAECLGIDHPIYLDTSDKVQVLRDSA